MFAKNYGVEIEQDYYDVNGFNRYPSDAMLEYNQSIEEGLELIAKYEAEDKADGTFTEDFYDVVDDSHNSLL